MKPLDDLIALYAEKAVGEQPKVSPDQYTDWLEALYEIAEPAKYHQTDLQYHALTQVRASHDLPPIRRNTQRAQKELLVVAHAALRWAGESLRGRLSPKARSQYVSTVLEHKALPRWSRRVAILDELLDLVLGLDETQVKRALLSQTNVRYSVETIYADLEPSLLYTPYVVLKDFFHLLKPAPQNHFVDLGCGLGRAGIVLKLLYPETKFSGYELVRERVAQAATLARSLKLKNCNFYEADLSNPRTVIPPAQFYFLFNPFSRRTLTRVLRQLQQHAENGHSFKVISIAVGRPSTYLKQSAWIRQIPVGRSYAHWRGGGFEIFECV